MDMNEIVAQIDAEISKLTQAKEVLLGNFTKKGPGRPRAAVVSTTSPVSALKPKKRKMSAAGRARIAAAQKARWAKLKKVAAPVAVKPAAKPVVAKAAATKPVATKPAAKKKAAKPAVAKKAKTKAVKPIAAKPTSAE